jgi:hypothetical protein
VAGYEVRFHNALYPFSDLVDWKRRLIDVLSVRGAVTLDADERRGKIAIGILPDADRAAIESLVRKLGVPPDVVVFDAMASTPVPAQTLESNLRPLRGSGYLQFWNAAGQTPGACTLGFIAQGVNHPGATMFQAGRRYAITASHCTVAPATSMGVVHTGTYAEQAAGPGSRVGIEIVDPAFVAGPVAGRPCPAGRRCRLTDALALLIDQGVSDDIGYVHRTMGPPTQLTINSKAIDTGNPRFGPFDSIYPHGMGSYVGMPVHKVGRTTGWTSGPVSQTCVDMDVEFVSGVNTGLTVLCSDRGNFRSDGGDSGAPIFTFVGGVTGGPIPVGVLWATMQNSTIEWSTFWSPFSNVVTELGVVGWLSVVP